jgi:hypothetical protein
MSAKNIDHLLEIWALDKAKHNDLAPFNSYAQMYGAIDAIEFGDTPWQSFSMNFADDGNHPADTPWKSATYEVWYRDPARVISHLLDNPDFDGQFDYSAFVEVDEKGQRRWNDFMSGNWAWRQSVRSLSLLSCHSPLTDFMFRRSCMKRMFREKGVSYVQLSSAATRPPSPLQRVMWNTTLFTFPSAMSTTQFGVPIVMLSSPLASLLFQRVCD